MYTQRWIRGPFGLDPDRWATRAGCRKVLVVVPNLAAGTRLFDLVPLLDDDHRLSLVYTVPDAPECWHGVEEFVRQHGGLVVPWQQALQHRFDLVLAASHTSLVGLHGPIVVVPHGASNLMSKWFTRFTGPSARPHTGLAREVLTFKGGVVPSVIGLTHDDELVALRRSCPEAVPHAVVAGDICFDRLAASLPLRERYRRALGVHEHQRLVTVSSTWSAESTFGEHPELCRRLLSELPESRYRVAVVLHPNIWAVHGRRQVQAWLAGCIRDGLLVTPFEEGWRAATVASDWVIGDHGSTTQYAAAIGRPVLLASFPEHAVRPGSIADAMARRAPRLDHDRPVIPQLQRTTTGHGQTIAAMVTSRPARAAAILRHTMYAQLGLPEPAEPARAMPVPIPRTIGLEV